MFILEGVWHGKTARIKWDGAFTDPVFAAEAAAYVKARRKEGQRDVSVYQQAAPLKLTEELAAWWVARQLLDNPQHVGGSLTTLAATPEGAVN